MKSTRLFYAAFAVGLASVAWVGLGFLGSHWLAFTMTAVIGAVFALGAYELRQFRAATTGLAQALDDLSQPLSSLDDWLQRVPSGLQAAVRQRVEGERGALPGPALTPYLVGLLVMLGMLGTFLGMVVTFKGAVFALQGSADLQAMRQALAEPIKGLGLSFGTSVAGVAASAMLGLMSALSRRERQAVARQLEARIARALRPFSLTHQRQESLRALQAQAATWPQVADKLDALMARIEQRGQQLDEQLQARQARFHQEATQAYTDLASQVGRSLQDSLAAGARAAGESIQPVVASAMQQITQDTQRLHARLGEVAQAQVEQLSQRFEGTARTVSETWTAAQAEQARSSQALGTHLQQALAGFTETFEQRSAALVAQVQAHNDRTLAEQAQGEQQRAQAWTQALQAMAADLQSHWQRVGAETQAQWQQVGSQTLAHWQGLGTTTLAQWQQDRDATLARWQQASDESLARHQAVSEALERHALQAAQQVQEQAGRALGESAQLLERAEALVQSRIDSEAHWIAQQGQRMDDLAGVWRGQLEALRNEEAARGQAAVDRLATLESAVAQHLATLGSTLEAPMNRLLHTAAEVPQAAAGVISQLREEMSRMAERDNLALAERTQLLAQLATLMQAVNQASQEQRSAIEALTASAGQMLQQATGDFVQALQAQAGQASEVSAHVNASAVELASLGEAFAQSVQQFQAGNDKLVEGLHRVETSLSRTASRSDEQLAYYVAQAREVIDLSITSQQGLVEALARLQGGQRAATADEETA